MNDAARRLRVLARLAPGTVHEAKNSLNVMSLHLQALSDRLSRRLPAAELDDLQRHLVSLRDHLHRVDALVARFGAHVAQAPTSDGPADLSAALSDAAALCAYDARKRRVTLDVDVPPGVELPGRRTLLEAFFVETLLGAIDQIATSGPGTLKLSLTLDGREPAVVIEAAALARPDDRWCEQAARAGLAGVEWEAGQVRLLLRR